MVAALAIAAAAASGAAGAVGQSATQAATPRIIGIVEVPRLFNLYSPDGTPLQPDKSVRVLLRDRPAPDGAVVATITASDALETREDGYEESGPVVYGRERGWSLVRTTSRVSGWIAPADSGAFHSLESLLDGLAYLTDDWDRFLYAVPGGSDRVPLADDPARRVVGYVTPVLSRVSVVLEPGQDVEEVRKKYRSLSVGSRRARDGTVVLSVETGVLLPVFEGPNVLGSPVTHMETNRADESLEATGSPAQVLVFDAQPGWYQVALRNDDNWRKVRRVWLQASALWRYVPMKDEAAARDLTEMTWGTEDLSVRAVGFQTIDGALWVNVEVMTESECASADPPAVRARGWVPAHALSGEPNIWFHSRGC